MTHSQLLFADNSKLNLCLREEKIFPHYPYNTGLKFWGFFSPCDVTEHCLQIWMCQLSLSWDAGSHRRSRNESCSKKKESFALWVSFVGFCCLFVSWVLVFVSNSETCWCSAITPSQRVVGMLLIDFLVGLYFIWIAHELSYPWDTSAKGNCGTVSLSDSSQIRWGFWASWRLVWSPSVAP